jgi:hypothetical protein
MNPRPRSYPKNENTKESVGMRWWENYLVRYLLGNIVGAVIVGYYFNHKLHWNDLAIGGKDDIVDSSTKLIILGVLGFAYCYIASTPILVLHAGRHLIIKKDDKKRNWLFFSLLWISIVTLIILLIIVSPEIINYLNKLNFTCIDVCCYGGCILSILTIIYVWVIACKIVKFKNNKETGFRFLEKLSKRRIENKDFRDSYSHLREHSNAFFIVLFELILLPIFLLSEYKFLPLIIALWIMPAALIWWYATWLEIKFSGYRRVILDVVPEQEDDIREFLEEISERLNNSDNGATGNLEFYIKPDANEDEWKIKGEGQVSGGQDNNGREIWRDAKLRTYYYGKTFKEAAEKLFLDYKSNYR